MVKGFGKRLSPDGPNSPSPDDDHFVIMEQAHETGCIRPWRDHRDDEMDEAAFCIDGHDSVAWFFLSRIDEMSLGFCLRNITVDDRLKIALRIDPLVDPELRRIAA